jgi:hypothetical protein
MEIDTCKLRIKRWKLLRIPFNVICLFSAWLSWVIANAFNAGIDEIQPAYLRDEGVILQILLLFVFLNVSYCLVYSIEFVLLAFPLRKWLRVLKGSVFLAGCICGFWIAGREVSSIAIHTAFSKRDQLVFKANLERMKMERLNAKMPKPTTLPAAQETHQP